MSTPGNKSNTPSTSRLLVQGVAQAAGFLLGALIGRYAGLFMGLDAFADGGSYSGRAMGGILLIGLGGGAGVQLARRWYIRRYGDPRI
ncbi:hypothetical protein [Variovorax sp. OV329]|uniref:hypothetical protein n=1 Tax=Variovorax sp. OV329 TaxID=1882825 RepID=UPI0008E820E2|nr:hypothetical protein [Variovorax sp. OV329]SFM74323.1 hypothetical protein SAMN05444747_108105 [Variovorax sp. OV329]